MWFNAYLQLEKQFSINKCNMSSKKSTLNKYLIW